MIALKSNSPTGTSHNDKKSEIIRDKTDKKIGSDTKTIDRIWRKFDGGRI